MNRMLGQKLGVIALLMLVIWIALLLVGSVIVDRQKYRDDAVHSIETSYAGPQTLIGPVLVMPYTATIRTTVESEDGGVKRMTSHTVELAATTFPHQLRVLGKLLPQNVGTGYTKFRTNLLHFHRLGGNADNECRARRRFQPC